MNIKKSSKNNEYKQINIAALLYIYNENDGVLLVDGHLYPSATQLTHFQNTLIELHINNQHDNTECDEFIEDDWNDIEWKNLINNKESVFQPTQKQYTFNEMESNSDCMAYLLRLNLKKLYYFAKVESQRLFDHILKEMHMICNKKYTANIWNHFQAFHHSPC